MAWAQAVMQGVGAGIEMYGNNEAARSDERNALFAAAKNRQNATNTQGAAQRQAEEDRRKADLLNSRITALAGGSAGDESVVRLMGDVSAEGELRALTSLYEGDTKAMDYRQRAENKVGEAKDRLRAVGWQNAGTIFDTGSSMYSKYGG